MLIISNNEDGFKAYLFSYNYNGSKWSFEICAESPEDALQRVSRLAFASYDGEVKAKVPAIAGSPVRFVVVMRNVGRRIQGLFAS